MKTIKLFKCVADVRRAEANLFCCSRSIHGWQPFICLTWCWEAEWSAAVEGVDVWNEYSSGFVIAMTELRISGVRGVELQLLTAKPVTAPPSTPSIGGAPMLTVKLYMIDFFLPRLVSRAGVLALVAFVTHNDTIITVSFDNAVFSILFAHATSISVLFSVHLSSLLLLPDSHFSSELWITEKTTNYQIALNLLTFHLFLLF